MWALSRIYHGMKMWFKAGLEIYYCEFEQEQPDFVEHHKRGYGPEATGWKQRWPR